MIDTNYKYAQWSMNVNPFGMHWQTYHDGRWYDKNEMTYDEAVESLKPEVIAKIRKDHPHLTAFDLDQNQVIQVNNKPQEYGKDNFLDMRTHLPQTATAIDNKLKNLVSQSDEKINKGTIEEQIEACTTIDELETFRLIAFMNAKTKKQFIEKYDAIVRGLSYVNAVNQK